MDTWPGSLQQKLDADTFEVKFGNTLVRTDMDVGPAKVRSRFTKGVDLYSASIILDFTEFSTFEDFYKTTLNNGALPFLFVNPLNNTQEVFRFSDSPDIRPLGGVKFKLTMSWERLPS